MGFGMYVFNLLYVFTGFIMASLSVAPAPPDMLPPAILQRHSVTERWRQRTVRGSLSEQSNEALAQHIVHYGKAFSVFCQHLLSVGAGFRQALLPIWSCAPVCVPEDFILIWGLSSRIEVPNEAPIGTDWAST